MFFAAPADVALVAIEGSTDQKVGLSVLITVPEIKLIPLEGKHFLIYSLSPPLSPPLSPH